MIYTIALTEAERSRIIQNLKDEASNGCEFDKQVLEAFTRGSIDNTQSPATKWADTVIKSRHAFYNKAVLDDLKEAAEMMLESHIMDTIEGFSGALLDGDEDKHDAIYNEVQNTIETFQDWNTSNEALQGMFPQVSSDTIQNAIDAAVDNEDITGEEAWNIYEGNY